MAKDPIDHVANEIPATTRLAKLPDGWWDGSAVWQRDYWQLRAKAAEARCRLLEAQLAGRAP